MTDPVGNLTTFAYDAADRLISKTTPTATGGAASSTYAYDLAGELTAKTDRDGRQTTYSYDSGGRLTGETWHNANGTTQDTITYAYNVDGQTTGASDSSATITMVYDSGGRLASEATSGPSGTQPLVTLTYGYDAANNMTSMTDSLSGSGWSGQGVTSYSYDAAFRLTTETQTFGGNAGPQVVFGYDAANRLTSIDRTMGGSGTSVNSTYSYDSANRLTTIIDQAGSTGLATFAYGYDPGNRLTSGNLTEGTYTYDATYGYDHSNELTAVTATLDGSAANESYSYDSGGNRTMAGYSTGADNALTASPGYTYTYDNEGNMISKTQTSGGEVWTYGYDDRNRLTSVVEKNSGGSTLNQATYVYDALDRRIGIDDNSTQTWTVFDGQNPYADFNASGTLATRYLSGAAVDEIFARTSASGTSAWYLTDNLGSVRDVVSSGGTVLDHIAYDSFGNITVETSASSGDRFKYAGLQWDGTADLYLAFHRAYDASAGRWISQDPLGFGGGDANTYRYVCNSVINVSDPNGLKEDDGPDISNPHRYIPYLNQQYIAIIEYENRARRGVADGFPYIDRKAIDYSNDSQKPNTNEWEAARHIYWQAYYTFYKGTQYAQKVGYIHEHTVQGNLVDSERDMHNNGWGQSIGQEYLNKNYPNVDAHNGPTPEYTYEEVVKFEQWLKDRVSQAIKDGEYTTIEDVQRSRDLREQAAFLQKEEKNTLPASTLHDHPNV